MSQKKVVLITGANSGFGRLTAESLARRGHRVFATLRDIEGRNAEAAREIRTLAKNEGLDLEVLELDLRDSRSISRAVDAAVTKGGRLDVVINNAGAGQFGVAEGFTVDQARSMFETNFFGAYAVIREALPFLRRQRSGLLVNVSTGISRSPMPFMGFYSSSKAALDALTEQLSVELKPLGIESVLVQPGAYPTPILTKMEGPKDEERLAGYGAVAEIPGKIGEGFGAVFSGPDAPNPAEVAEALVELVEAPTGTRPLRTLVGRDVAGLQGLNDTAEAAWKSVVLDGFGVSALVEEASAATAGA